LAHRAGLEAHREFFVKDANAAQPAASQPAAERTIVEAAGARRPACAGQPPPEGFPVVYSDLGYILVGAALERLTGRALDELVEEEVAQALGLTLGSVRRLERTEPALPQRLVPTENVPWRGGVLRGVVHDENAWVLADRGSAGHAGLFADVWSVVRLGTSILDAYAGRKDGWLTREELDPLVRPRPGGTHRAGFDGRGADAPSSGALFGEHTFGHLGFTGTSMWLDPEQQLVGVLLTNRVHPTRDHLAIREARPRAYDAIHRRMMPPDDAV
jgi:CubicO group peptidase (beta-lactamase class C family)